MNPNPPAPPPAGRDVIVLVAGSHPMSDRICTSLTARGARVQQVSTALAGTSITAASPTVALLLGDAVAQHGAKVRAHLARGGHGGDVPVVLLTDEPGATATIAGTLHLLPSAFSVDDVAEYVMGMATRSRPQRATTRAPRRVSAPSSLRLSGPIPISAWATAPIEFTRRTNTTPPASDDLHITDVSLADMSIIATRSSPTLPPPQITAVVVATPPPLPRTSTTPNVQPLWLASAAVVLLAVSGLYTLRPRVTDTAVPETSMPNLTTADVATPNTPGVIVARSIDSAPVATAKHAASVVDQTESTAGDATAPDNNADYSDSQQPETARAAKLCDEGHALRARGRLGLAEAKYLQALAAAPRYARAVAGVVRVHLTRGDGAEAVRWGKRLVAIQPNRGEHHLLLGDAYAVSGRGAKARVHWRKSATRGNTTARKRLSDPDSALAKVPLN